MKDDNLEQLLTRLADSLEASHRAQLDLLQLVFHLVQDLDGQPEERAVPAQSVPTPGQATAGGDLRLRDTTAAAEFLGLSKKTLDGWRVSGRGPRYYKMGRVLYAEKDLLDWLKTRNVAHTTEADSRWKGR